MGASRVRTPATRSHEAARLRARVAELERRLAVDARAAAAAEEERRHEAEVIAALAADLAASRDLEAVLARVTEAARSLCGADAATIALPEPGAEPGAKAMAIRYRVGVDAEAFEGFRVVPGKGIGGEALVTGRPARTRDYRQDPRRDPAHEATVRAAGSVAVAAAPIRGEVRVEGLLYASRRTEREFTDHDEAILLRLADLAAIALRNVRLLEELRSRQARLETLLETSRQLSRIQSLPSLLARIAEGGARLLGGNAVGLRLVEGDELVLVGSWGGIVPATLRPRLRIGESLSGLVAATGEPLLVNDVAEDPRLLPEHREICRRLGSQTWLGVPIWTGDRLAGVVSIETTRRSGFSPEDLAVVHAFASQMATALENARLFQETQQALEELRRTQDQLVQSQKMEAIGRLAGGVAHDFNNLLTVIRGRSEMLVHRLHPDDPLRGQIALIDETAHRAAALTQQLLAFSRRQMLQPRVFDLNQVVAGMGTMLRRLIGEDVLLVTTLHPEPIWIKADPGQVEQVILNLAVNGRDAMPQGGRLSLQTAVIPRDSRPHARLAVSDTGAGMTPEIQAHLFEPFFTTKGVGQGTGLGLATVYGIVEQSGGQITVESAPGQGTRFAIHFPWLPAPEPAAPANGARPADAAGRSRRAPPGAETVLLVEDEAGVRELAREILELEGYTVLEAADGPAALALAREAQAPIDLLLTDVVMPHLGGGQLAARLVQEQPDLRVLFMSGYTEDAIVHHGVRDAGAALLPKPFTPDGLVRKVRETLDAVRAAP
jgi:signal transduction histidine kinase/ActR/RegA family two-component response regulator/uncharacterized protein YigA (DUF484 family)